MAALTDLLDQLNRKERYWLLRSAVGSSFDEMDEGFKTKLCKTIGCDPANASKKWWWAFDYHLDWIAVVLRLKALGVAPAAANADGSGLLENSDPFGNDLLGGSQQDVDLLVCCEDMLILVEAKAGTGWSRSQMDSKNKRLGELAHLAKEANISLFLVLCSPGESNVHRPREGTESSSWPEWALKDGKPYWIPMEFGRKGQPLYQVRRRETDGKRYRNLEFIDVGGRGFVEDNAGAEETAKD